MIGLLGRFLVTTVAVIIAAYILPGVHLANNYTPLVVAMVLGLLNMFLKPLLVFFTLPFTLFTFGLFLLVINTFIVKLASSMVSSFYIDGWWTAFFFGVIISLVTTVFDRLLHPRK